MSQLRVHELAKELELNKQELVSKINDLSIGIVVNNYMTVLSDAEAKKIKKALESAAKKPAAKAAAPKVRKEEESADSDAASLAPAPVVRRRRKVSVDEDDESVVEEVAVVPGEEPEEDSEPEVEDPDVEAEEEAEVVEEDEVAEEEEAEEVAESEEAEAEEVEPEAESEKQEEEEEEVEEDPVEESADEPKTPESDAKAEPEAEPVDESAETPAPAPAAKKPGGGAQVLGAMSQSVIMGRLAAEGKDFSPGPKRRSKTSGRGSSKRVVEGRDLYDGKSRRNKRRSQSRDKRPQKTEITTAAEHKRNIRIEDAITVGDLAHQMGAKSGQVAMKLVEMGMMANVNTMLDYDTSAIIAEEFGYTVENVAFDITQFYDTVPDEAGLQESRPPVVTVMGHVDHGKTSLLDAVRSSDVAGGEAGGITQHIGAYQVATESGVITFLDTPGHEAFTALRARGARSTDIVILVVAADDGVMPQTVEAINHSRDAGVPIIVAVNKIDKEGANPDRVKQALAEYELIPEEWGGTTLYVEVSALTGQNIDKLIESVILQAEIEELRANPDRDAQGLVVEAELDIGRGPVATMLVQRGTLRQGDIIVSGQHYGRVRTMADERGKELLEAPPSQPVVITGLSGVPEAGEPFFAVEDERDAKRITAHVQDVRRKEVMASRAKAASSSLEDLAEMVKRGEIKELKVIIKADVQGSVEALKEAFDKLGNDEVTVKVIHAAVGGITENDVNLAASSEQGAVVVGFNVRPDGRASDMAEKYGVQVLTHSIIYDAIERIRALLEGMLAPIVEENIIGRAEVRETFSAPKVGTIAGCYVQDGLLRRNAKARLLREGRVIYDSTISSLRRFKDDVREVKTGFECGLSIDNFNDIKIGDIVEAYEFEEVAAVLE